MNLWPTAERVGGIVLLYLRFGLYETEEGRLHSYLTDLWVRVSDMNDSTRKRLARLLGETARLSVLMLDHVFGPRLFSVQAAVVSVNFAFSAIIVVATSALFHYPIDRVEATQILLAVVFLSAALAPVLIRRTWAVWIPLAVATVACVYNAVAILVKDSASPYSFLLVFTAVVIAAPIADFLWLVLFRLGVKRSMETPNMLPRAATLVLFGLAGLGSFLIAPDVRYPDSTAGGTCFTVFF